MHAIDVKGQIACPICGHTVRCYQDERGRIAWCYWCGTVAAYPSSKDPLGDGEVVHALRESVKDNLLARARLNHSRKLYSDSERLAEAIEAMWGQHVSAPATHTAND